MESEIQMSFMQNATLCTINYGAILIITPNTNQSVIIWLAKYRSALTVVSLTHERLDAPRTISYYRSNIQSIYSFAYLLEIGILTLGPYK